MTARFKYYQDLKQLARDVRTKHKLNVNRVLPLDLKRILKKEGVEYIDLRENFPSKIRGMYFNDETDISIVVRKGLPRDPYAFTLAHELKHHLVDSGEKEIYCTDNNLSEAIEIGAEIFAAEFLFPENEFIRLLSEKGIKIGSCKPEDIVKLKFETDTTLSHTGLAKRAEFLKYALPGSLSNVKWKKLKEDIYGKPDYLKYRKH